jgi:threonine aldolase
MISFESDYNNGTLPEILKRFVETNDDKTTGYGLDPYCEQAKKKIRKACDLQNADIFFLIGGTQTNTTVIDSLLAGYEGVITAQTGHINVHESGAVEAFGHKVITIESNDSKLSAASISAYMDAFLNDETYLHTVQPRMVYITFPTELGAIYRQQELADIYEACKKYHLYLFVDGARLGYGLMSDSSDITMSFLASHCDVFYIGGTKVGAMFGEAVVYTNIRAPRYIFTIIKRHGALLAKGRMLGIQFDTLFTENLYLHVSRHAIEMANQLKKIFQCHHINLAIDSPTNQQFVILSPEQKESLMHKVAFEVWQSLNEHELMCRFVTSWATMQQDLDELDRILESDSLFEK